ncbi:hypothetical protein A4D02_32850 [Niastella koreensis]|uniref:Secreted protein n=2 Tax=Niastella koreensis TaxID=354356 RepID=G8T8N7_NIAKG|nr:hypothetical protein [Niastella koreensis]AEW01217.1 hypothetical protein Niako_4977 [Niastella koreensis GR20-10]OQP45982.1 hypothetical protein A4D02_32850 [Niastella koreensis]
MKNVKITLGALAFLTTIATTYAFKKLPSTLFIQQTPNSCVAIACHENDQDVNPATGLPEDCDIAGTKYRTQVSSTTCSNPVTVAFKAFN